jgi:deoxyribodipyrimidine photo-lyase
MVNPQTSGIHLAKEFEIENVFTNHDYEPYAKVRDEEIKILLQKKSIQFNTYKDQVIFEKKRSDKR